MGEKREYLSPCLLLSRVMIEKIVEGGGGGGRGRVKGKLCTYNITEVANNDYNYELSTNQVLYILNKNVQSYREREFT